MVSGGRDALTTPHWEKEGDRRLPLPQLENPFSPMERVDKWLSENSTMSPQAQNVLLYSKFLFRPSTERWSVCHRKQSQVHLASAADH